jgi:HEAT repeat protein
LAAVALRRIGWDVTTPLLIAWLDDEPEVAVAAAGALGAIGDSRAFYPLLRVLGHPMATVRQAAVSALHSIGHADMPSVIASRLADPSPEVREAAARVAGYFGYQRCHDRLVRLASDPVSSVRRVAVEALASYDDRTAWLAIANAAAGDADPMVRAAAIRACRDPRSREVEKVLEAALDDKNLWVRYHGIHSLARRAAVSGVTPGNLAPKLIERARNDSFPPVRIAAIEAIAALHLSRGLPALIDGCGDSEPDIAAASITALGSFDVAESRGVIRSLLETQNLQVKRTAMEAAGRLGQLEAVDALADAAAHAADDLTRRIAIAALGRLNMAESTKALVGLLANRSCRADASRVLAAATGDALSALIQGLEDPQPGIRCTVIEILGRVRRADMSRTVSEALGDSTPAVRNAAAQALTRRDLRELDEAIAAARADENASVRNAASSAPVRE